MIVSHAALWILVLFQTVLLIGVVRALHTLQLRSASGGTPISRGHLQGQEMPSFEHADIEGNLIRSDELLGQPLALLFVSPSCRSCTLTLDEMDMLAQKVAGNIVLVCRSSEDECRRLAASYALKTRVISDGDNLVSNLFEVDSVPTAVLVDEDGRISSYGHPMRAEELADMMNETARRTDGAFEGALHGR